MMSVSGFLLGIASGGVCLAYCAPVLVPYLLGEGRTLRANLVLVGGFLSGRLAGYMTFAVLAWFTHAVLIENLPHRKVIFGLVTVGLATLLIAYGFIGRSRNCPVASPGAAERLVARRDARSCVSTMLMPISLGFLTGVNVCPPFLLAFTSAAQLSQLWESLLFFGAFFVGTSLYVVPLPLVGLAGRHERIRIVGRLAAGVVGLFYLYSGTVSTVSAFN
ncbi:MAG: sulfite exporter TauE/SafE family protein [Sedimentisphaerales bacterium]|nr:sulfite exporter TauE/SafE family protein [Sedimentisphaerales bacterium]